MNIILQQLTTEVLQGIVAIAFILITHYGIKYFKAGEEKAKTIVGANNFNYAKDYIEHQLILNPGLFETDSIVSLIDNLDNKFGDRLSKDTIRRIVDIVKAGVNKAK